MREIAARLGLPVESLHLAQPTPSLGGGVDRYVPVLPQPARAYAVAGDLPPFEPVDGDRPGARLRVGVTAERIVTLADGQERLRLAGQPDQLVVRRVDPRLGYRNSPEIMTVAFPRSGVQTFDSVEPAWKSYLVLSAAAILGMELAEILVPQLDASAFAGNDAFAKREAAQELERDAAARTGGRNLHWVQARIGLAPHDFDLGGWRARSLSPALDPEAPEADRVLQISLRAEGDSGGMFIPMPPDEARAFQAASATFPEFDALMSLRVTGLDTTYLVAVARGLPLLFAPAELVAFDAGQGQTVIDESAVRLRHSFAPSLAPTADAPPDGGGAPAATGLEGGIFPVLGVAPGADFEASAAELSARLSVDRRLYARTDARQRELEQWGGEPINDRDPYHNGILLEAPESRDVVAVYHEPPGAGSTVTAMSRTRLFGPGAGPTWPALRDTLREAYPQLDASGLESLDRPTSLVIWNRPPRVPGTPVDPEAETCTRSVNAAAESLATLLGPDRRARANDVLRPVDGRATWVDDAGAHSVPSVASPPPLPLLFGERGECPLVEVLVVILAYSDDGRVTEYREAVSMPVQVASLAGARDTGTAAEGEREVDFEEFGQHGCVADVAGGELSSSDLQCLLVDPDVDLAPDEAFGAAMLAGVPLSFAFNLDAGAVDQQAQRPLRATVWDVDL